MAKKSKKKEDETKKVVAKCDNPNEVVANCNNLEEVITNCDNPQETSLSQYDIEKLIVTVRGECTAEPTLLCTPQIISAEASTRCFGESFFICPCFRR
jgi:hypothetical protein